MEHACIARAAKIRRPDRHRGPRLELSALPEHAPGAAPDQRAWRERAVHALEQSLRRDQVAATREHHREVWFRAAQRARGRTRSVPACLERVMQGR